MPDGGDLDHSELFEDDPEARIVTICDQFEAEWRDDRSPRIEDYLERAEPDLRDMLFPELIAIEVELRRERGEDPTPDEFHRRFPESPQAIADAFSLYTPESNRPEPEMATHPSDADISPNSTEEGDSGASPPDGVTVSGDEEANGRPRARSGEPLPASGLAATP